MPRVLIGRTHDLYGKSLWQMICNLKNFGVGRVVVRTKVNRHFPERSWYRVIRAQPDMDPELRQGTVAVSRVYRGRAVPGEWILDRTTAATDYQLIPRHEEADFCRLDSALAAVPLQEIPRRTLPKPPLVLELERITSAASCDVMPDMPLVPTKQWHPGLVGDEGELAPYQ